MFEFWNTEGKKSYICWGIWRVILSVLNISLNIYWHSYDEQINLFPFIPSFNGFGEVWNYVSALFRRVWDSSKAAILQISPSVSFCSNWLLQMNFYFKEILRSLCRTILSNIFFEKMIDFYEQVPLIWIVCIST